MASRAKSEGGRYDTEDMPVEMDFFGRGNILGSVKFGNGKIERTTFASEKLTEMEGIAKKIATDSAAMS